MLDRSATLVTRNLSTYTLDSKDGLCTCEEDVSRLATTQWEWRIAYGGKVTYIFGHNQKVQFQPTVGNGTPVALKGRFDASTAQGVKLPNSASDRLGDRPRVDTRHSAPATPWRTPVECGLSAVGDASSWQTW